MLKLYLFEERITNITHIDWLILPSRSSAAKKSKIVIYRSIITNGLIVAAEDAKVRNNHSSSLRRGRILLFSPFSIAFSGEGLATARSQSSILLMSTSAMLNLQS